MKTKEIASLIIDAIYTTTCDEELFFEIVGILERGCPECSGTNAKQFHKTIDNSGEICQNYGTNQKKEHRMETVDNAAFIAEESAMICQGKCERVASRILDEVYSSSDCEELRAAVHGILDGECTATKDTK